MKYGLVNDCRMSRLRAMHSAFGKCSSLQLASGPRGHLLGILIVLASLLLLQASQAPNDLAVACTELTCLEDTLVHATGALSSLHIFKPSCLRACAPRSAMSTVKQIFVITAAAAAMARTRVGETDGASAQALQSKIMAPPRQERSRMTRTLLADRGTHPLCPARASIGDVVCGHLYICPAALGASYRVIR